MNQVVGRSCPAEFCEAWCKKRGVVTEEISVGKQQVQDTERVSGTVRREAVRIDSDGDVEVDERR